MTSVTDGEMASSRLHISATLTVFIEVPKEVEQNRCNQGSHVSDPKTASPARCKESKAYKRLVFFSFFFPILFKVVLWFFLGATTAWWQESEWQSTNCLHLLNPAPSELPSKSQSREILLDVIGQNWFCFVFQWLLCLRQKMKRTLFIYLFFQSALKFVRMVQVTT